MVIANNQVCGWFTTGMLGILKNISKWSYYILNQLPLDVFGHWLMSFELLLKSLRGTCQIRKQLPVRWLVWNALPA